MTVHLTRDLLAVGYTSHELARRARSGELVRLRRGAYDVGASAELSPSQHHLLLLDATLRMTSAAAVVSHQSSALVHGLPLMTTRLPRVQLTRSDRRGGRHRGLVEMYTAALDPVEVVELNGLRVTSLARTVVDLGRLLPFREAVMAGDAALRQGTTQQELQECLDRSSRRPGMLSARRVVRFLDGRSESPGESLSRVALHEAAVPAPQLQLEVRDSVGRLVGRADFAWEDHRTLGEFDGRTKYGRLLKPGDSSEEAVYREKRREDALRDCGWQVVRWSWADLRHPDLIGQRLYRAFDRARR